MAETPRPKIDHIEDHMLTAGASGFHHSMGALSAIHNAIASGDDQTSISIKHRGTPSIVFGHHPDNGRFFVAKKPVGDAPLRPNFSEHDVARNHPEGPEAERIKAAIKHLPKIAPKTGVFHGEVVHTGIHGNNNPVGDVHKQGEKYSFASGTNTRSAHQTTDAGRHLSKAKIGVSVHTAYKDMESLAPSEHNIDLEKRKFTPHPDVHIIDAKVDPAMHRMSPVHSNQLRKHLAQAEKSYSGTMEAPTRDVEAQHPKLKDYLAHTSRKGTTPSTESFKKWLASDAKKSLSAIKTTTVKAAKAIHHDRAMKTVDTNKQHFKSLIDAHQHLSAAKSMLIRHLNKSPGIEHTGEDGKAAPDNFVAIVNGKPSKLSTRTQVKKTKINESAGYLIESFRVSK